MSRVGPVPDEYQRQEKYQTEAAQCGGMEGTPAAQQKGFDPNDPAHVAAHSRHRLPDGTRPMPWHANSPTWLYGIVFAVTASVNGWLKTQPREVFDQFIEEVFKPAVRNALLVLGEAAYARQQVDGKVHRVKADLVGLTAVHATARDGNLAVHSHTSVWRWGLCPDGQLRSWHDRRFLYRHFGQALEVFHRSIAAGIEAEFGQRTEVINNRAEVPGLPQPLLETQGTRRKAALEYLAEKGVPATPESVQIAVYKTRPASQDWDLAERVPHWNREARQALGPEAGRWMKPDVGAPAAPQQPAPAVAPPLTPQPTPAQPSAAPQQPPGGSQQTTQQATAGASATQQSTGRQQQTTGQQSTAQQGGQQQQAGQQSASGQQAGQQQQQQRQRSKAKFSFFRNAQGGRQSASAARKSAVLMATINAFLREVGTTAKLIARKAFVRRPDVVKVLDVDGAYHAFRDRTVKEAFKDLRDDLRRKNTDSWNAVLTLGRLTGEALKKFLAYRRPKVVLKAGTVLLVGREAQQTMSKEQKDRLEALAHKKRFVVRYAKAQQQGQQQQTQQTQTP